MGCGQCSSGSCGSIGGFDLGVKAVKGCSSGACGTSGCNKMNSFDWLANMTFGKPQYNVVEMKFKGGRKEYFINKKGLELYTGDFVVCEMPTGYHIGTVSLQGELVRLQLLKKGIHDTSEFRVIQRLATEQDLEKHSQAINRDLPAMYRTREICKELNLDLKLSEVEFQSDNTKATFYYSADDRVDFRELIKRLASEFKVRIEMRQISLRQEAARLGGIGSCGRELCCSTWLSDFKTIPTAAARYQNLSLNPAKLSGQCGRLKCCLNYELETYIDAIRGIPSVDKPLQTEKGDASLQKTDIFRRIMWFSYPKESDWISITTDRVEEIQKMNSQGKKPQSLEGANAVVEVPSPKMETANSDLELLDKKYTSKKNKKKPKRFKDRKPGGQNQEQNTEAKVLKPESRQEARNTKPENRRNRNENRPPKPENSIEQKVAQTNAATNDNAGGGRRNNNKKRRKFKKKPKSDGEA